MGQCPVSDGVSGESGLAGLQSTQPGSFGERRKKDKKEKDGLQPEKELFIKKHFKLKTWLCASSACLLPNGLD